jgi:2-polyprenyl-3-methyl-5-hydroxy-6-metoxy-1,4-benzoquinol methylase
MKNDSEYIKVNKQSWDQRTQVHVDSEFYNVKDFLKGKSSLNEIELALLPDVRDKNILHLQCHFGMDTISLSRMGAKMTGVDFSLAAIENAIKLSQEAGQEIEYVCSDVYELDLKNSFDMIFSSYGVIGWLPDMDKWARTISSHLKKNGKFIFVEFHPVVWMFDTKFEKVAYKYSKDQEIIETETGTYANKNAGLTLKTITWNHGLAEVIDSLIKAGLEIVDIQEYDYSPYDCFEGTEEFEKGKFRIKHLGNKIPMIYSLVAIKK